MSGAHLHISIFGFRAAFSIIALRSALMADALSGLGRSAQRACLSMFPERSRKGIVH
jgi:hypothetical protein